MIRSRSTLARFGAALVALTLSPLVSSSFGQATVTVENLPAGGQIIFPTVVTGPTEVNAMITTPLSSLPASFAQADTIVHWRNSGGTSLRNDDDDFGVYGIGAGTTTVANRGSLVRVGGQAAGTYDWRTVGFGATDAGFYAATRVKFIPGVTPGAFNDTEPNGTVATAQPIALAPGVALLGYGSLTTSDLDYFSFNMNPGDVLTAFIIPLSTQFSAVDTRLDLRNSADAIIISDDDAGSDLVGAGTTTARGGAVHYLAQSAGAFELSVRGFTGTDVGNYALVASIAPAVPEPTSLGIVTVSAFALVRRRRAA